MNILKIFIFISKILFLLIKFSTFNKIFTHSIISFHESIACLQHELLTKCAENTTNSVIRNL